MPYGDPWRDARRMAHHEFHASPVKRFRPIEQRSTNSFLLNMHRQPEKMMDNLRQCVLSRVPPMLIVQDSHSLPFLRFGFSA